MDFDLAYIYEEVDEAEYFVAKKGRDPGKEKWMDARGARNQMYWWMNDSRGIRSDNHISKNGIPYDEDYGKDHRNKFYMNGFRRLKKDHFNGKMEHRAWRMGLIHGKNGRIRNKLVAIWKQLANEALNVEGF